LYTQNHVVFDGASINSAVTQSSPVFIGDYRDMTVSLQSVAGAASAVTIQGSNDPGLRAAIVNWSTLTVLTIPGVFVVDPGVRWARFQRASVDSRSSVVLQGKAIG
jgi:hypothetical protein